MPTKSFDSNNSTSTNSQQIADEILNDYNNQQSDSENNRYDENYVEPYPDTDFVFAQEPENVQANSDSEINDSLKMHIQDENRMSLNKPEVGPSNQSHPSNSDHSHLTTSTNNHPVVHSHSESHSSPKTSKISLSLMWFILAIITLISFLSYGGLAFYNYYQSLQPTSKFSLLTSKKIELKPDIADNVFLINLNGKDSADLNSKSELIKEKFVSYLKEQGISDKDIQISKNIYPYFISGYSLNSAPEPLTSTRASGATLGSETASEIAPMPNIDIGLPAPDNRQFTVQIGIEVTIRNIQNKLSNLEAITAKSLELGITNFRGYNFRLENTEKVCKDLQKETTEKLITEAKEQLKILGGKEIISTEIRDSSYAFMSCYNNSFPTPYPLDSISSSDSIPGESLERRPIVNSIKNQELQIVLEGEFEYR